MGNLDIDLGKHESSGNIYDRSITIYNGGIGGTKLNFSIESDSSWLTVSPSKGVDSSGDAEGVDIIVNTNPLGLALGEYVGVLSVTDPAAGNTPYTIDFLLEIVEVAAPYISAPGVFSTNVSGNVDPPVMESHTIIVRNIGSGTMDASATLSGMFEVYSASNKYDDLDTLEDEGTGFSMGEDGDTWWDLSTDSGIADGTSITVEPIFIPDDYSGSAGFLCDLILSDTNAENDHLKVRLIATSTSSHTDGVSAVSTPVQQFVYNIDEGDSIPDEVVRFSCSTVDSRTAVIDLQSVENASWLDATPISGITEGTDVTFDFTGVESLTPGIYTNLVLFGSVDLGDDNWDAHNTAYSILMSVVVS